jgi:hypothetical protein
MSNRFIITEYRKWSKFKNPDFNQVYEADLSAVTITAAPTEAPNASEFDFSNEPGGDKPAMSLWVPLNTEATGVIIEVANVATFSPVKATYQLTYPDVTSANIEPTSSTLGWSVDKNSYYYKFLSTPDTQYYVRMYYTNSKGKGPVSDTVTDRSYKAGYNPDSTVPEEVQVDPDFLTASKAAFDRKQNWIPYKGKTSGNYTILYGQVGTDPNTGDPEWQVALAKDAKAKNGAGVLTFKADIASIMTQEGGFQDGSNTGTFYSQALGGNVYKLWICTGTDTIYLKQVGESSSTGTGTAQLATGEQSTAGDYYTISKLAGENFADKGIFKVDSVTSDGKTTFKGNLDSAKGLDEFALMKYLSDGSKLKPRYNGPVYTVNPGKILAHATSLYEAYADYVLGMEEKDFGTEEDIVIRVIDEIEPLELLILSIVWDNNLWSDTSSLAESRKLSNIQSKIYEQGAALTDPVDLPSVFSKFEGLKLWWFKSASEFSSFPNATPFYKQDDIDTGDWGLHDIVEIFPSATRPSFLIDMIYELEDDDIDKKKFAQKLRGKYAALLDETKYPKKFFTVNSISGKPIINTNDKALYDKYFKSDSNHFFLSSIAQIYINELDGYIATDEWND